MYIPRIHLFLTKIVIVTARHSATQLCERMKTARNSLFESAHWLSCARNVNMSIWSLHDARDTNYTYAGPHLLQASSVLTHRCWTAHLLPRVPQSAWTMFELPLQFYFNVTVEILSKWQDCSVLFYLSFVHRSDPGLRKNERWSCLFCISSFIFQYLSALRPPVLEEESQEGHRSASKDKPNVDLKEWRQVKSKTE